MTVHEYNIDSKTYYGPVNGIYFGPKIKNSNMNFLISEGMPSGHFEYSPAHEAFMVQSDVEVELTYSSWTRNPLRYSTCIFPALYDAGGLIATCGMYGITDAKYIQYELSAYPHLLTIKGPVK